MTTYTEQEMRQFFENIISQFVSLSAQAKELEELKGRVTETETAMARFQNENYELRQTVATTRRETEDYMARVERLEQDNGRLKHEVEDAQVIANSYSSELAQERQQLSDVKRSAEEWERTVVERDQRIQQLEGELQRVKEDFVTVRSERDAARSEVETLSYNLEQRNQHLTKAADDAEYWKRQYEIVKGRLDTITNALSA